LDVEVEEDWKTALQKTLEEFGKLDILVNNSGKGAVGPLEASTLQTLKELFATNMEGVYLGVRYGAEVMKKNPNGGSIINITSMASTMTLPAMAQYSASKAAAEHFTKLAALEYAPFKIRVNAVAPGQTVTEIWEGYIAMALANGVAATKEEFLKHEADKAPLKMLADVEDIAQPILFLASDAARFITGISILADGGVHLAK
jgi:NAD(P)-dependent dehydrogenase (short-subunit alcohol dehydrogenase family)